MIKSIRIFAISALTVWLPWVLWAIIKTYFLNDPDSKFGAEGGVIFVAAIWGLAAIISGLSAGLINTFATNLFKYKARITPVALSCGLVLSLLATLIPRLPAMMSEYLGEIAGMVLTWFIISCTVFIIGHLIDYWTQPNKTFQPT